MGWLVLGRGQFNCIADFAYVFYYVCILACLLYVSCIINELTCSISVFLSSAGIGDRIPGHCANRHQRQYVYRQETFGYQLDFRPWKERGSGGGDIREGGEDGVEDHCEGSHRDEPTEEPHWVCHGR